MFQSRLRKVNERQKMVKEADAPNFSEVLSKDDLEKLKSDCLHLFEKPFSQVTIAGNKQATACFYGIQHYWKDLQYPLYYAAEVFKWRNEETKEVFPVFVIHELNDNGTIRTKFFDTKVGDSTYDANSISLYLNSHAFGSTEKSVYFLEEAKSWNDAKSLLDENWLKEKLNAENQQNKQG